MSPLSISSARPGGVWTVHENKRLTAVGLEGSELFCRLSRPRLTQVRRSPSAQTLVRCPDFQRTKAESRPQPSTYYFTSLGCDDGADVCLQNIGNAGVRRAENILLDRRIVEFEMKKRLSQFGTGWTVVSGRILAFRSAQRTQRSKGREDLMTGVGIFGSRHRSPFTVRSDGVVVSGAIVRTAALRPQRTSI